MSSTSSLKILPLPNHGAECFLNTALNMFRLGNSYTTQIFKDKEIIEKIMKKIEKSELFKKQYDNFFIEFTKSHEINTFFDEIRILIDNPIKKKHNFDALYPLYVSFYGLISFFQLCDFILHDKIPNKQLLYGLLILKKIRIVDKETQLSWCGSIPCDCSRVILTEMLNLICNYYPFFVNENINLISQTTFNFDGEILPSIPIEVFDDKTSSLKTGIYSLIKICVQEKRALLPFDDVKSLFFFNNLQFGENELPICLNFKDDEKIHKFILQGIGVALHYDVASFNASHHFSLGISVDEKNKKMSVFVGNDGHFGSFELDFTTFSYDIIRKHMEIDRSFPSIVVYNKKI